MALIGSVDHLLARRLRELTGAARLHIYEARVAEGCLRDDLVTVVLVIAGSRPKPSR